MPSLQFTSKCKNEKNVAKNGRKVKAIIYFVQIVVQVLHKSFCDSKMVEFQLYNLEKKVEVNIKLR
jgi:hypothetical protein